MQTLTAHEYTIAKILCSDYDFTIPDYQRPYAWGEEEALDLLGDLDEALERDTSEPYFLGSIVLVKSEGKPGAEVIDGQQRLTTLTILLAVLRDLTDDDHIRTQLADMVREPGSKLDNLDPKPRLRLRRRDADFFSVNVQMPGATAGLVKFDDNSLDTEAQKSIRENVTAIRGRLESWGADRRDALASLIRNRVFLVVVLTPDLVSAHRIFSVMNARGLDLTPADIIKATVIGDVPDASQEAYATKWEDAEQQVGREAFKDLFLHTRLIVAKKRAVKALITEYESQVLCDYLPGNGTRFCDDLLFPYAKAYDHLLRRDNGPSETWQRVNAWLQRLELLDNQDWRPVALWAMRRHADEPLVVEAILWGLDRLASSMFLRRVYTTPRVQRYIEGLKALDDEVGASAAAFDLTDTEIAETVSALDGKVYLTQKTRKFILLRLDEVLEKHAGVTYDHPIITVEHVLPQNPRDDSEWRKDFDEEQREKWTHRLANLVLLNTWTNSAAQNYDFAVKKAKYFSTDTGTAAFSLTTQVLTHDMWTPGVLDERQKELLGRLRALWRLEPKRSLSDGNE